MLKTKHAILFTFFNNTDYNLKIIKIDLFIFNFALSYVINGLFFNDDTMHKIYEDKGKFNLIYQLPQIAYSTIISMIIDYATSSLSLSQDNALNANNQKK